MNANGLTVLQVDTSDVGGGAERVVADLHTTYLERGIDSWVAVGYKQGDSPRVVQIPSDEQRAAPARAAHALAARSGAGGARRLASRAALLAAEPIRYGRILRGIEDYGFPATARLLDLIPSRPDVLHLHNLHGYYFDLRMLPRLTLQVPTILTLHDAWLLTGHCAHPMECPRWEAGCGECPSLDVYVPISRDASRRNRDLKRDMVRRSRLRVATPSQWLMSRVEESGIADGLIETRVIPNGVDTSVFTPGDKREARRLLDLPQDRDIILFAAQNASANPYKDFDTLLRALALTAPERDGRLLLLALGGAQGAQEAIGGIETRFVPYVDDRERLALFYRAADLFVHPALAESFGLTLAESMACGTPVVSTRVGGIPEVVADGVTGLLVGPSDAAAFARAMAGLLGDPDRSRSFAEAGVRRVRECFTLERQADAYIGWYEAIAGSRPG